MFLRSFRPFLWILCALSVLYFNGMKYYEDDYLERIPANRRVNTLLSMVEWKAFNMALRTRTAGRTDRSAG
jgi:hypothetical protein